MFSETTPITREQLLAEANQIIRDHEDYMKGMVATDVEQKGNVLVFRGEFFWMKMAYRRRRAPRPSTCLSIWPTGCQRNTTWPTDSGRPVRGGYREGRDDTRLSRVSQGSGRWLRCHQRSSSVSAPCAAAMPIRAMKPLRRT